MHKISYEGSTNSLPMMYQYLLFNKNSRTELMTKHMEETAESSGGNGTLPGRKKKSETEVLDLVIQIQNLKA